MLKIVHIDTGRELRGGQRQLLILARGLRARGHEQVLVCPEGGALEARARAEGFQVFALPPHDPGNAHGILQLRQLLLAAPADILHAHDGRGQTLSWLASLGMRGRRVASRRVTFAPDAPARQRFIYGRTCHTVIAVSDHIRKLLVSVGVPEARIEVIPDSLDWPQEVPGPEVCAKARAAWGFADTDFIIGHVGAFTREKGQDLAVKALCTLREKVPQARLVLVGGGPQLPQARAEAEKAPGSIRFIEHVENLAEFFPGLNLYVMPSRAEGLGSSALLAMGYGLPVVATRVGGLPEIVEDGKTGWLVTPESPEALAQAIAEAASDGARLRRFGAAARERARAFSSDIICTRVENLYRRLAGC